MFLQCCLLGLTHSIDRYIVFELLKNVRMSRTFSSAMVKPSFRTGDIRDQLPTHRHAISPPEIRATISTGSEEVQIRISDQGKWGPAVNTSMN